MGEPGLMARPNGHCNDSFLSTPPSPTGTARESSRDDFSRDPAGERATAVRQAAATLHHRRIAGFSHLSGRALLGGSDDLLEFRPGARQGRDDVSHAGRCGLSAAISVYQPGCGRAPCIGWRSDGAAEAIRDVEGWRVELAGAALLSRVLVTFLAPDFRRTKSGLGSGDLRSGLRYDTILFG